MKICIIAEGCYPYVVGGVSGWINNLICSFPRVSFSVLAIISDRSISKKFQYTLPENVTEVHEVYLNDCEWTGKGKSRKHCHLSAKEAAALKSLLLGKDTDWVTLTTLLQSRKFSLNALLMGPDFLDAVIECYEEKHSEIVFSDFLWTMRSMYLPLFLAMQSDLPKADLYHCVATGYSGVLGSMAKLLHPESALLISEHGIYTREREEEIIKASWIRGLYKNLWIEQFAKMSHVHVSGCFHRPHLLAAVRHRFCGAGSHDLESRLHLVCRGQCRCPAQLPAGAVVPGAGGGIYRRQRPLPAGL